MKKLIILFLLNLNFSLFCAEVKLAPQNNIVTLSEHNFPITNVVVSPDEKYIASGDTGGEVLIWDASNYNVIANFSYSFKYVRSISWSPDSTKIVVSYRNGLVKIYSIESGKILAVTGFGEDFASVVKWVKDDLIAMAIGNKILLFRWLNNQLTYFNKFQLTSNLIDTLSVSYDSRFLASGDRKGFINIWDINNFEKLYRSHETDVVLDTGWDRNDHFIYLLKNGLLNYLRWNVDENENEFFEINYHAFSKVMNHIAFSPDGRYVVASSLDGYLTIWDLRFDNIVKNVKMHDKPITSLNWTSKFIISSSTDETIKIWKNPLDFYLESDLD